MALHVIMMWRSPSTGPGKECLEREEVSRGGVEAVRQYEYSVTVYLQRSQ